MNIIIFFIFSGVKTEFGLTDYISSMSNPAWVWSMPYEFPRFYTWNDTAKEELFAQFNYIESPDIFFRGMFELKKIDFEIFDLPNLCNDDSRNMSEYCTVAEKVPDLEKTLDLMNLASNPVSFNDNLKERIK